MSSKKSSSKATSDDQLKIKAKQAAKAIKNAAKTIRKTSTSTREVVKTFSDSGAVLELAESVQAAASAARDTAEDVRDTTKQLRNSHVAAEAANAVEKTLSSAEETAAIAKETAGQIPKSAPVTSRRAVKVARKIHKSTKPVIIQAKKAMKTGKAKPRKDVNRLRRKLPRTSTRKQTAKRMPKR